MAAIQSAEARWHFPLALGISACYAAACATRLSLRTASAAWNGLLAAYSLYTAGSLCGPLAGAVAAANGDVSAALCTFDAFQEEHHARLLWLFVLSKVVELGDTALLKAKGRAPSLLHVYHHTSVLAISALIALSPCGASVLFTTMNACVHTVMYGYYFLASVGVTVPFARAVTSLQIAQMVVGATAAFMAAAREPCAMPKHTALAVLATYISYFALFVDFYRGRYKRA